MSHVTSTTTIFRITSMSMISNIAKNLHGYNGTDLMKQKFEQKNTSFPEFMMKVVDVTVSTQMSRTRCG